MSAPRDRVEELKTRPKAELKRILGDELGSNYIQPVTGSLRNDFMLACYRRLDTGDHPKERLQSHENYTPAWKQKKRLATALRMVLTERVGHPEHKGITSLDKAVLAELIVGIRMCGDELEASTESGDEDPASDNVEVPREPPVPCHFEGTLPAEEFDSYALYDWVVNRRSQTDGEHGVYVLDCTPPFAEAEDFRVKALRADAKQKTSSNEQLTKLERAAHAATNGQRLYYVGYASDVPKRVRQHVGGAASGGAKYTNMFEPQALVDVSWYMTEGTARAHERRRAEELTTAGESNGYAE